jgi:glycosyltransferase involved in cell wall biosynthesis
MYRKSLALPPAGFRELIEREKPDLIHFHAFTLGAGLDHARVARAARVPYVITFHTPSMACPRGTWLLGGEMPCDGVLDARRCATCLLGERGWPRPLAHSLSLSPLSAESRFEGPWTAHLALPSLLRAGMESWREFFLGARRVVACAEFAQERLIRNGIAAAHIRVLRQALPGPSRTRILRMPTREPSRALRLGFFGRVTKVKGPDLAVEAAATLRQRGLDLELELAGPIYDSERGWANTQLFRERPWVRHLGTLHGDALRTWIASLDLVLIPSRWFETGPLTLLESWNAGVPVIGTDLGGIAEFMRAEGLESLLFQLNDAQQLVRAIERALRWSGPPPAVRVPGMDDLVNTMLEVYRVSCGA